MLAPSAARLHAFILVASATLACSEKAAAPQALTPAAGSAGIGASAAGNTGNAVAGQAAVSTSGAPGTAGGAGGTTGGAFSIGPRGGAPTPDAGSRAPAAGRPGTGNGGAAGVDECPDDPSKTAPGVCGCGTADADADGSGTPDCKDTPTLAECKVGTVPDAIRTGHNLNPFYQKYADANGLPVVTSSKVADKAITLACQLVTEMLSRSDAAREALIARKMRFTLIAASEQLSDLPEIGAMYGTSLNMRARGLGSIVPTVCAEENILCQLPDLWAGENICVHEYAHTIADLGFSRADPMFRTRLDAAFRAAQASGKFANTYAISKVAEFWAEGVQDWYNSNLESRSGAADGTHNSIDTREELKAASPELHDLISSVLPADLQFADCYAE